MSSALLPSSSTRWERAMADAMAVSDLVTGSIGGMRRVKYVSPRPSMLPYLVYEYGLGELTPYVPNLYDLIDQGVRWQRLRGTVSSVAIGLAWIGYAAALEEAWTGRRFWNAVQLRFAGLPANDQPDLERIEGITGLSLPERSKLRRGVYQYDIGPLQADHSRLDSSMLGWSSGVAVTSAGTLWSFGRTHEFEHTLTEAEGLAIGNWIDPVDSDGLLWIDIDTLWPEATWLWSDDPVVQRRAAMSAFFLGETIYARLSSEGGVIGYRRCRVCRPVRPQFGGAYEHTSVAYHPGAGSDAVYIEAMTQFGDADDVTCTTISLMVGGGPADGVKAGALWLAPNQFSGGAPIAVRALSIPLRTTVRDQFKFMLRF